MRQLTLHLWKILDEETRTEIIKVMICLPVCTGEELNRDSVCDRVSSVGCPCVGEGGGVAATRWRCFSSRDSKIPAANVASNM